MLFQVKVICLGYTKDIFSESALSKPGIYLVYTRVMTAHFKSCNPSCSKIAIGMPRHTGFRLQGCLMFITARGVPTGHPSARAWTRAPGTACPAPPARAVRRFAFAARAAVHGDGPGGDGDSSSDSDGPGRWWWRQQGGGFGGGRQDLRSG